MSDKRQDCILECNFPEVANEHSMFYTQRMQQKCAKTRQKIHDAKSSDTKVLIPEKGM